MGEKNPTPISQNPIPVSPNPTPVSQTPTAVSFSLNRDGIRNRILEIRDKHGCTNSEQFSQLVFGDKSHAKTIDKWTGKDSTTIPTIDSLALIAHSTGVSLDWLVFGKDNPPSELQEELGNNYIEINPRDTVRGLLATLMCLSTYACIHNFKIEAEGSKSFCEEANENGVKISFSIGQFRHPCFGFYNTPAKYLINGLKRLSDFPLLNLPNNDETLLNVKMSKYLEILNAIPSSENAITIYHKELKQEIGEDFNRCSIHIRMGTPSKLTNR